MTQKAKDMTPGAVTCGVMDTAADAARMMKQQSIGDVIVLDDGKLCGMVTDRDIVVRVIAEGRDAEHTPLRDICTNDLATVAPGDDTKHAVQLMTKRAVRRLPIVDDGKVVGILTMGDPAVERDEHPALAAVPAAQPSSWERSE